MLVFLVKSAFALDHIVISEVLYDPINSETGGEAVMLYNPGITPINISGWVLATETSPSDAILPSNALIMPNSYYLVADAGWSSLKDNASWPDANHEETITLTNLDAGISLMNGIIIVDSVGWGNPANINPGLFEGIPANGTPPGKSLRRKFDSNYADTDNNANDFFASTPSFAGQQVIPNGNTIEIYAIVEGQAPVVESIIVNDEDATTDGTQIFPVPKINKSIFISVQVSDTDSSEISSVVAELNSRTYFLNKTTINSTTAQFYGYVEIPFYASAGNYTIKIAATDNANLNSSAALMFEYLSLIGIEIDSSSIIFNAMPGKTSELIGDSNSLTPNLSVRNIGNAVLDMKIFGTDLASGNGIINASSIKYTFSNDYNSILGGTLHYSEELKDTNLMAGQKSMIPLSLKLSVPQITAPGNYTGSISLIAVAS